MGLNLWPLASLLFAATVEAGIPKPRLTSDESFAETYTVVADLEGTYVQLQLAITNAGMGSAHGLCRLLVVGALGHATSAAATFDREQWHADGGQLVVGPCSLSGSSKSMLVSVLLQGHRVDLELESPAVPTPLPGVEHGEDFYQADLLVGWARANAELQLEGGTKQHLRGFGYADHSRGTMLPKDLARGWLRFRGLSQDCPVDLLVRWPPKGGPEGWLWRRDAPTPARLDTLRVKLPPAAGTPTIATAIDAAGLSANATFGELLFRHAPAKEFGFLGRLVSHWVGSTTTRTFRGSIVGLPGCPGSAGIIELSHLD